MLASFTCKYPKATPIAIDIRTTIAGLLNPCSVSAGSESFPGVCTKNPKVDAKP